MGLDKALRCNWTSTWLLVAAQTTDINKAIVAMVDIQMTSDSNTVHGHQHSLEQQIMDTKVASRGSTD